MQLEQATLEPGQMLLGEVGLKAKCTKKPRQPILDSDVHQWANGPMGQWANGPSLRRFKGPMTVEAASTVQVELLNGCTGSACLAKQPTCRPITKQMDITLLPKCPHSISNHFGATVL